MTLERAALVAGVLCVIGVCWVDYSNQTDDWFAENRRLRLGLPIAPWFDHCSWSNRIEGGGHTRIESVGLNVLVLLIGILLIYGGWPTRNQDRRPAPAGGAT
jgi:hypothetical protein